MLVKRNPSYPLPRPFLSVHISSLAVPCSSSSDPTSNSSTQRRDCRNSELIRAKKLTDLSSTEFVLVIERIFQLDRFGDVSISVMNSNEDIGIRSCRCQAEETFLRCFRLHVIRGFVLIFSNGRQESSAWLHRVRQLFARIGHLNRFQVDLSFAIGFAFVQPTLNRETQGLLRVIISQGEPFAVPIQDERIDGAGKREELTSLGICQRNETVRCR